MAKPLSSDPLLCEDTLAWACNHAGCTDAQASVLLLYAEGNSLLQIARELGLKYQDCRDALRKGTKRLKAAFAHKTAERARWYRFLLRCVKNSHDSRPAPILPYAPVHGGGWEQVTLRAKPHGALAEDYLTDPADFLRVLFDDRMKLPSKNAA